MPHTPPLVTTHSPPPPDIIAYCIPRTRQRIVDAVTEQLANVFALFHDKHPEFDGPVWLCGHSLGGVISFDLLNHQVVGRAVEVDMETGDDGRPSGALGQGAADADGVVWPQLPFEPSGLLTLGAPLGLFLALRADPPPTRLPTTPRFVNLFHPLDPVAYRMEPLLDDGDDCPERPPELVPFAGNESGYRAHVHVHRMFTDTSKVLEDLPNIAKRELERAQSDIEARIGQATSGVAAFVGRALGGAAAAEDAIVGVAAAAEPGSPPPPPPPDSPPGVSSGYALNDGGRVDWELQGEGLGIDYVAALTSHTAYFTHADVAAFAAVLVGMGGEGALWR
jgi:hypothetical protein